MINLFNINDYTIDTARFSNLLHDNIVTDFEKSFAEYVGAKYACSANSASSLIYLATKSCDDILSIPSCIPPVVPNALEMAGARYIFQDDVDWVGSAYTLIDNHERTIVDSAQEVTRDQFKNLQNPNAEMIFSFYPTKPVGGCDGGMIVSDNKATIDKYKEQTLNGMSYSENSWERKYSSVGYKMHWNSISAYIANENLKKLDEKYKKLDRIREIYNKELHCKNKSRHLYRIRVENNNEFIKRAKELDMACGIHYKQCHKKPFYKNMDIYMPYCRSYTKSMKESRTTVSIPFHEKLSENEIDRVINNVKRLANI